MLRSRTCILIGGGALVVAAVACNAFSASTNTTPAGADDAGGGGDVGGGDGAAPLGDAQVVSDGSIPNDSSSVPSWCTVDAGNHDFCDDFDEGNFATNWPTVVVTNGGSVNVVTTLAQSRPSSLRVSMLSQVAQSQVFVHHQVPTTPPGAPITQLTLAFDFYVESLDLHNESTIDARLFTIATTAGSEYSLQLALYKAFTDTNIPTLDLYQGNNDGGSTLDNVAPATAITLQAWHRLSMHVDLGNGENLVQTSGTIDGETFVVTPTIGGTKVRPGPLTPVFVALGTSTDQTALITIYYDNVTIDTH